MKKIFGLAVVSMALFLTSCATLVNGTKQTVSFNSEPSGASVILVNKKGKETTIGTTPMVTSIPRKTKKVKFSSEGFYTETYDAYANASVHWLYWVDAICGLVPAIVDISTGGYILLEENVKVELKKK
ncbi:MAG: hypothetical protein RLZZ71_232 [Bacteroidota bacterium]|jgi:hypothetical protein